LERAADRDRVAHPEGAAVVQADHVACHRVLAVRALARLELLRLREAERLAGARYHGVRSRLESARAHADERDPVTVTQVHVRLHLEHEAGEGMVDGVDGALLALACG